MLLTDLTKDLWDRSYEVDLKAHFLTGKTVMPRMIEQKRRVYDYFF
jgi:NAD(P)-dependent dehydrogenase (short-subunit alcohol dehydrogenase family)